MQKIIIYNILYYHKELDAEEFVNMSKANCSPCHSASLHEDKANVNNEVSHCKNCDFFMKDYHQLDNHIQSGHKKPKLMCPQCDYECPKRYRLNQHIRSKHHNIVYRCKQCDYTSRQPSVLKNHVKVKHEGALHTCSTCGYRTTCRPTYYKHKKDKHEMPLESPPWEIGPWSME